MSILLSAIPENLEPERLRKPLETSLGLKANGASTDR
jgi:hypothetical protein